MTKRTGGTRKNTRKKLRKKPRSRGKIPVSKLFQKFEVGEKVRITHEPAIHKGMPHPKYKNRVGKISGKRGKSLIVELKEGKKEKQIISNPVHLTKIENGN